ncbi:hypothetical protein Tco_1387252, partial [Tanacetum coccineum]
NYLGRKQFGIQDFFEKQKLTGPNFINWYQQLQIVLSVENKKNYLEYPIPAAPVAAPVAAPELKTMFSQQAEQELLQTMREFRACRQEEGQSISSYVLKMKSYIINLERLGQPVSLRLVKNQKMKPHKAAKGNQGKGKAKMGNALVPAPSFAPKPMNPPTPKKDNHAKDAI